MTWVRYTQVAGLKMRQTRRIFNPANYEGIERCDEEVVAITMYLVVNEIKYENELESPKIRGAEW